MERIRLIRKGYEPHIEVHNLVIFDELITGLLNRGFFVIEQWGRVLVLSEVIGLYLFPAKDGKHELRLLSFLSGHSPEIMKTVEFYEDDTIEVDTFTI